MIHAAIQQELKRLKLDGYLAIDFKGRNEIALEVLGFPPHAHITRRWFYWIPQEGEPYKLNHVIEPHLLQHLPGAAHAFISYEEFCTHLKQALSGAKKIALDYSPFGKIPSLSYVDGGTLDLIHQMGLNGVSSQEVLQPLLSVLTPEQLMSQRRASLIAEKTMHEAWDLIAKKGSTTEGAVQQFILRRFEEQHLVTEWSPIVAVGPHAALPHYTPQGEGSPIHPGDFILIDLGCKEPQGVYADITRVAVFGRDATAEEQNIFSLVKQAQEIGFEAINLQTTGAEVDRKVRRFLEEKGYGQHFLHRTGHNITTKPHGPGAHLDSLETEDDRPLLKNTCFSVEPGIYLEGRFGIRLESTVLLLDEIEITGGIQSEIFKIY
jgi:Xaa-Pro aminopeptidase